MGRIVYVLPAVIVLMLLMGCSQQQPAPAQAPPSQPPVAPQPPPPQMNNTVPPEPNASSMNQTVPNATSMNQTGAANNTMNQTAPPGNGTGNTTHTAPPPPPPQLPPAAVFSVDANDAGFYMNGNTISSLSVAKGSAVTITFNVLTSGVYHSGLDFRGCGQSTSGTPPGQSVDFKFAPSASCSITSYWPSTGVSKKTLQIIQ